MENQPPQQCVIPIHKPSKKELLFFFISGIVVSVPIAFFFENLVAFVPAIVSIAVLAPFVEELAKVFPLFYRHGETERSLVTLGVLIGLGFGISELVEYVVFLNVPLIVRIPGVVFHASSAAITAYGVAKKNPWPYYLISVTLHATNNFFSIVVTPASLFIYLFVLIAAYLLAYYFYNKASKEKIVV